VQGSCGATLRPQRRREDESTEEWVTMYQQIVVGTDGSPGANVAVDAAVELARLTGARLHVVHAHKVATATATATGAELGAPPVDLIELNETIHTEAQRICDQAVARADRAGVQAEAHCVGGHAGEELLRVASAASADLVVVGNRGMTGMRRFVLGSVPNKVAHSCSASVLIVDTSQARA
jgi:nucleotide-binding universal stress UspA family protein